MRCKGQPNLSLPLHTQGKRQFGLPLSLIVRRQPKRRGAFVQMRCLSHVVRYRAGLAYIPNSSVVQLSGRRFPGIVVQGDTLSNFFDSARYLLGELKRLRDEERYFEVLMFAEQLQAQ